MIRTGTEVLWGGNGNGRSASEENKITGYAYVDSIIGYNLKQICNKMQNTSQQSNCATKQLVIDKRRQRYPLKLWDDPDYGRLSEWMV